MGKANARYRDYVAIDIETTGLSRYNDDILEIAAVRVRNNEIVDMFSSLVNPGYHILPAVTKLTGITDEMVADAPDIEPVLLEFMSFVGNDRLLGHNINRFDAPFINQKTEEILGESLNNETIDTMYIAREIYPAWKHHRLMDLVGNLGIDAGQEHRALNDAVATHESYQKMPKTVKKNLKSITDDIEAVGRPKKSGRKLSPVTQKQEEARRTRAETEYFEIVGKKHGAYLIRGAEGDIYRTTLMDCSCPDHTYHCVTCKHMYWLASYLSMSRAEKRKLCRKSVQEKAKREAVPRTATASPAVSCSTKSFLEKVKEWFGFRYDNTPEDYRPEAPRDQIVIVGRCSADTFWVKDGKIKFVTSTSSCTCADFYRDHRPCRHMSKVALYLEDHG